MQTHICRMCLQPGKLLKKSHIIPAFMYKGILNEQHQAFTYPFGRIPNKREIIRKSDGEYESNILCENCDNKLLGHFYEDYASKTIYGGKFANGEQVPQFSRGKNADGSSNIRITHLNYQKFKLFLLSILWRSSISNRPLFNDVKLPSTHQEIIRKMLLDKNSGHSDNYPIRIMSYGNITSLKKDFLMQPRGVNRNGANFYAFLIAGFLYLFLVGDHDAEIPKGFLDDTIKESNEMLVQLISESQAIELIHALAGVNIKNKQ